MAEKIATASPVVIPKSHATRIGMATFAACLIDDASEAALRSLAATTRSCETRELLTAVLERQRAVAAAIITALTDCEAALDDAARELVPGAAEDDERHRFGIDEQGDVWKVATD